MAWVSLDDRFPEHPKNAALSDRAFRAQVSAICYCKRNLTDGFLPTLVARGLAGSKKALDELTVRHWEPTATGYYIHDYLDWNWTRDEIEERAEAKSAGGKARAANAAREGGRFTPADAGGSAGNGAGPKQPAGAPASTSITTSTPSTKRGSNEPLLPKPRERDPLWDAMVEVVGTSPETRSERGRWNHALRELREVGATDEEIRFRATVYATKHPDIDLTPTALSANWSRLTEFPTTRRRRR